MHREVRELKDKPGVGLQVHGSGALIRSLLDNDLVDEMNLLIVPVVVGQGTRQGSSELGLRMGSASVVPSWSTRPF